MRVISDQVIWISRVPETIKGVTALFERVDLSSFQSINPNHSALELGGFYRGITQRWNVVHWTQAEQREIQPLNRQYLKTTQEE